MWTWQFVATAVEHSVVTGLSTFAGTLVLTTTPTWKDVAAAGTAAGIAFVYSLSKNLGATQLVASGKATLTYRSPNDRHAP